MHSSRVRTARSLTGSPYLVVSGGGGLRGMHGRERVCHACPWADIGVAGRVPPFRSNFFHLHAVFSKTLLK